MPMLTDDAAFLLSQIVITAPRTVLARLFFSRMISAVFVHTKGFGEALFLAR